MMELNTVTKQILCMFRKIVNVWKDNADALIKSLSFRTITFSQGCSHVEGEWGMCVCSIRKKNKIVSNAWPCKLHDS